ncbi:deoxyguanosinetriphosphate triphosphohydrolase-like protein [compost metagenome]
MFTIDDLLYEFQISEKYREAYDELNAIVNQCRGFAKRGGYFKSSEEHSFLFRKELTSKIVNRLIRDVFYDKEKNRLFYREHVKLAEGLKMLVFSLIMRRPSVQLYEKKGEKVLRGLYEVYKDANLNKDMKLLPPEYRIFADDSQRRRNIIDFISGMMDQFAMHEFEKYYGTGELDKLM